MGTVGHKNKGGGVPGKGPIQGGSLGFQMKGSPYNMSASQENTFGPSGSNPNPGVYSGIKAADANKSGSDVPMNNMDIPLQKRPSYDPTSIESIRTSGSRIGNVLRDITGKRNRDRNATDTDTSNDTKTNAGKIIDVAKSVGQSIVRHQDGSGGKHRAGVDKKTGEDYGSRKEVRRKVTADRVARKAEKRKGRWDSRGGKRSDIGQFLKNQAVKLGFGKHDTPQGAATSSSTTTSKSSDQGGFKTQNVNLSLDKGASGLSDITRAKNLGYTGPDGKRKLQAELSKKTQKERDFMSAGGPLKKKPLYKKGPLNLAAVSGDDDNKGDKKKNKKEDKKKSKIEAANAKSFKTQDVDLTT